ncbi:MAG: 3-isopropylmalate dehydrogenase, partial [Clostridiales Family XIII bacterium]|nr:3-isopropylmalate dehydrogenase [Clostridiales Family XIII bacterium]
AFCETIQTELEEYGDALEFRNGHVLNAEPLRIDVVVIKKQGGTAVKKNIGQIFRGINVIEYKSPKDYISVDDFYKTVAYAYQYKVLERTEGSKRHGAGKATG